jgi:hypothetical protein
MQSGNDLKYMGGLDRLSVNMMTFYTWALLILLSAQEWGQGWRLEQIPAWMLKEWLYFLIEAKRE